MEKDADKRTKTQKHQWYVDTILVATGRDLNFETPIKKTAYVYIFADFFIGSFLFSSHWNLFLPIDSMELIIIFCLMCVIVYVVLVQSYADARKKNIHTYMYIKKYSSQVSVVIYWGVHMA